MQAVVKWSHLSRRLAPGSLSLQQLLPHQGTELLVVVPGFPRSSCIWWLFLHGQQEKPLRLREGALKVGSDSGGMQSEGMQNGDPGSLGSQKHKVAPEVCTV